jgi:pyruvate dehydrogenase E1 component beta subunit
VLDTPISESAFIGASVGAALTGLRPVVELQFVDFMGVCLDQIFNQGAKFRYMHGGGDIQVPMVVRCMIGAGVRAAAHQSSSHYSTFTHFPGLKTVVPSTPADAKGLMLASIRDNDPVVFFEHKMLYSLAGEIPEGDYVVPLGRADVKREGDAVTIVAIARMVHRALEAAEQLAADGIEAEVVDPRTLSPLDMDTLLQSVRKTGRLVVVDEDNPRCSVAADIVASICIRAFNDLKAAPQMVTAPHTPVPFAAVLEDFYIPSVSAIVEATRAVL